jgi:hypothetical protein
MTNSPPETGPNPKAPEPVRKAQEEAAEKERKDGTDLGEEREPA